MSEVFDVEIKNVFMFPFGEFAVKVNAIDKPSVICIENTCIQGGCPRFLKTPLMWITYKIIRREFRKINAKYGGGKGN